MSVAEKLIMIAENEQRVYDKGFADGKAAGGDGQAEYDRFWDTYQQNGERQRYTYAFSGGGWNENTFRPKYNIYPIDGTYTFYECEYKADLAGVLNELGVSLDLSRCTGYNGMFYRSAFTRIPKIVDRFTSNAINMFISSINLVTIDEIELEKDINNDNHYRDAFTGCNALENIKFTGVGKLAGNISFAGSPKLTRESIVGIINALSSTAIGKTLTLNLTAVRKAFETASGVNDGNTSEEWLNLIAMKSNWTIALA